MPRRNYPKNRKNTPDVVSHTLDIAYTPDVACRSKRRFATEKLAIREIETQELLQPNLTLHSYECQWCKGWHLTRRAR